MGKTRGTFSGYIRALRARGSVDESTWDDLEEALLRADVGMSTTPALIEDLRSRVRSGDLKGPDSVLDALKDDMRKSLDAAGSVGLGFEQGATQCLALRGGERGRKDDHHRQGRPPPVRRRPLGDPCCWRHLQGGRL